MQKVELTRPFEITCNKIDAQAYIMRMGELPLHEFVHYCKHVESHIILNTARVQYKPMYVLTFFLPLVKPLSDCHKCWQMCPGAVFVGISILKHRFVQACVC